MTASRRRSQIVAAAVAMGVAGSLGGSAVYVWGPMHVTYERMCEAYPLLRALGPVPLGMLAAAVLTGIMAGALTLAQVLWDSTRISKRASVARVPVCPRLRAIGESLRLSDRLMLVADSEPYAFCQGMLSPRVWVSTGLMAILDDRELRAVLAHERAHLCGRDPLRGLIGRALSRSLLFVPLHEEAYRVYRLSRELAADRDAVAATSRMDLASALLKIIRASGPRRSASAAVAAFGEMEERVRRLTGQEPGPGLGVPWPKGLGHLLLRSGVSLVVLGLLATTSQEAVVGCLI